MLQPFLYRLNAIGILIIAIPMVGALIIQLTGDLPCPLCLLQRVAMLFVAMGAMMNLRFGIKSTHYGYALIGALFGSTISIRQILLHICDGPGAGYGGSVLGLHLYTWALIVFFCYMLVVSVLLTAHSQFSSAAKPVLHWDNSPLARFACGLAMAMAVVNMVMVFLLCGPGECPDNPVGYWIHNH